MFMKSEKYTDFFYDELDKSNYSSYESAPSSLIFIVYTFFGVLAIYLAFFY